MWPLFDRDGDGVISMVELSSFLSARRQGRKSSMELQQRAMTDRQTRIRQKTTYHETVWQLASRLRTEIVNHMALHGLDAAQVRGAP